MSNSIPDKIMHLSKVKEAIKTTLDKTNQDTNVPFRQYTKLIENIPNTGALSLEDIDELTKFAIDISGEKA